ncbi:MAG TPA: DNA cytosine methyltransferase, partial [Candidatus Synoicihabitans sp.]|nr:DNA cytosine methyltransferase [Candidatus Synoicihabitans sp.]
GLRNAAGGRYFTAVQYEARNLGREKGRPGYRVHPQIERGEQLGAPQKRRRQLIIGVRADLPGYFPSELRPTTRACLGVMLGDAILDLPKLPAGAGENESEYDLKHRTIHFLGGTRDHLRSAFLERVAEVGRAAKLYNHVSRPHSARDLRDFERIPAGSTSAVEMRQGVKFEFPYDKTSFKDRYTRQHRNRLCSTIVAHLAKDGLMFIHPTQNRSLTPREAARVQTFPDWFIFPEARTHAFRLIGNAVPPLISEAVGDAALAFLRPSAGPMRSTSARALPSEQYFSLPRSRTEAVEWLDPLTKVDRKAMRSMPTDSFLRCWHALLWLFPDLHPENALEHGDEKHDEPTSGEIVDQFGRRYTRSGWPVMLEAFGLEAWRRFELGEFSDEAFYCVAAQRAGLEARRQVISSPRTSSTVHQPRAVS